MTDATKITILHLAVDYNTPSRPPTTHAVEWFVDELREFNNVVLAFERSATPLVAAPALVASKSGAVFHFPYFGLPFGIGLHWAMRRAANQTIGLLKSQGIRPDLIHAHKFTFEGLSGWYVARHFRVPLFISLRGEVETKVIRWKPTLRRLVRRIAADASHLYFVSSWFQQQFHQLVSAQPAKERLLPNIVRNVRTHISVLPAGNSFVTVVNLDTWRRKGLRWLIDGFALALKSEPNLRLEIIGGGSTASISVVEAMIAKHGLQDTVTLVGAVPNREVLQRLGTYRGLLLPSLNETFGMVYVEALFAGIPILLTKGTAIDGYLDGLDVGYAVPPKDAAAISAAILAMSARQFQLRANIMAAGPELFARFDPASLIHAYAADVRTAIDSFRPYEY